MAIHKIKNPEQIKNTKLKKIIKTMPVKLTNYLLKLTKTSPAIAKQFLPDIRELEENGIKKPFEGTIKTGIEGLERMYLDRCIIMPTNECPAYCRFCFRKFYKKSKPMSYENIDKALAYIKKDKRLKSILITGGDPLMDIKKLEYILKNLRKIAHIRDIRIGTRSPMFAPEKITDNLVKMLLKYHNFEKMKPVEIAVHFNHPDEITQKSTTAITKLTSSPIKVYNQTVLLKDINDDPKILIDLFEKLHLLGVEIYALYHCDPVKGVKHFRTSVQKGIEIKKALREMASGRINPAYIIDTQIGKVEIGVDSHIEKREGNYIRIKTPYKNKKGFISVKYLDA